MSSSIQFRQPPGWFFKFPPDNQPQALPPPTDSRTFAALFPIREDIYTGALDYRVPITIGALYAVTAIIWNKVNRERGYKPYTFSKTKSFHYFVIAHNVFLAAFSALTFLGMIRALAHTWPGREHHLLGKFWPGLRAEHSVAGAADALCNMHGPRGFGQSVNFDPVSETWNPRSPTVHLGRAGLPDSTDVGRLWNEGLAFWGWWFYLSKFYEVLDTFIILAKGKRSSTLQTYHHTGAMMCMWAGIRFMSPPIWMFCFLNSGIHTMMYVYYTLSALSIRVPQRVKRTLTTMQISQFLIGITFAAMHLFVTYRVPISKTATVSRSLDAIASSMVAGVSSAAATATSSGVAAWLKQAALRAAGEEGLAENVLGKHHQQAPLGSSGGSGSKVSSGWEEVSCINTSGQAFAIWLNLAYLAPLTLLFVRFFVKSYTRRGSGGKNQSHRGRLGKSLNDAAKGTDREFDSIGKKVEDSADGLAREFNGKPSNGNGNVNGNSKNNNHDGTPRSRRVSSNIEKKWERFEKGEETPESVKSAKSTLKKQLNDGHDKLRRVFEEGTLSNHDNPSEQGKSSKRPSDAEAMSSDSVHEEDADQKPELEESWADVARDTYPKPGKKQQSQDQQAEGGASSEDVHSTSSPSQSRPASPEKKSQIPRPSGPSNTSSNKSSSRSRSPIKKAPSEEKSSSLPRPASALNSNSNNSNNGTTTQTPPQQRSQKSSGSQKEGELQKPSSSTSSSSNPPLKTSESASSSAMAKSATSPLTKPDAQEDVPTTKKEDDTESEKKKKHKKKKKKGGATSHSTDPSTPSGAHDDHQTNTKKDERDTNVANEQDSSVATQRTSSDTQGSSGTDERAQLRPSKEDGGDESGDGESVKGVEGESGQDENRKPGTEGKGVVASVDGTD